MGSVSLKKSYFSSKREVAPVFISSFSSKCRDHKKCSNCVKSGHTSVDHTAYDPKCPEIISFANKGGSSTPLNM